MFKRLSNQKNRHQLRNDPVNDVLDRMVEIAREPFVISIDGELQSEYNVLGMWIYLTDDVPEREWIAMEHRLYDFLQGYFLEHAFPFHWSLGLWRNGSPISSISNTDRPRGFCNLCQSRYDRLFDVCPHCGVTT